MCTESICEIMNLYFNPFLVKDYLLIEGKLSLLIAKK